MTLRRPHPATLGLLVAVALYVGLSVFTQRRVFAFSEELMLHTSPSPALLPADQPDAGPLVWEPSCSDADPPTTVVSRRRPVYSLCAGGRRYPIIVASYMSGYFYWLFAPLAAVHQDDVRHLRQLAMLFGLLDLLLTFLLVRRLTDPWLAAGAAIAMAVTPCFQVTHSALLHFETLSWTFLMAAGLALARVPELGRGATGPPPTKYVVLAALCVGLAGAVNFKAIFLAVPMALVAKRLGVRVRAIRLRTWALSLAVGVLPLVPAFAFARAHPDFFLSGDRSADIGSSLEQNILQIEPFISTVKDMVVFWSSLGRYLDPSRTAPISWAAMVVVLLALPFVLVAGVRVLWRKNGCPVTAGTAALLITQVVALALLDRSYPVNFTPLHTVFGLAVAVAGHAAWGALAGKRGWAERSSMVVAAGLAVPMGVATVQTGHALANLPAPINLAAEEAMVAHLQRVVPRDGQLHVATTENLVTGIVESLSRGEVQTAQVQDYLVHCRPGRHHDEGTPTGAECYAGRFERIFEAVPARPLWVVAGADLRMLRRMAPGEVPEMEQGLADAGRRAGLAVVREAEFETPAGLPALVLFRVEPAASE